MPSQQATVASWGAEPSIQPIHDSCSHPSGPQAPNQPSWRLRVRVGRTRKENPTTCSRHRGTPGTVGSVHAKYEQGYIASRALCLSAKLCPVLQIQALCSMKLTAVHHQRPALVLDERMAAARCLGSPYPAQKRLRNNGLSERRRVPRGESEGLMADRHRPWSKLAGLSSRIQAQEA